MPQSLFEGLIRNIPGAIGFKIRYFYYKLVCKKIGKNGKEKYMKYFNSTLVADYILNQTFQKKNKHKNFIWENK